MFYWQTWHSLIDSFFHFWHVPLAVCSAKHRHQCPEWTILSHVSCFIQGEVIGFQVLLDSLHPHSMRASQWSPPVVIVRFLFHCSPSISRSSVKTLDVLFLFISRFQWHQIIGCRLTSIVCTTSIFYWLLLLKSFFPRKLVSKLDCWTHRIETREGWRRCC